MSTERPGYYFIYAIFAELYNSHRAVYIFEIILVGFLLSFKII